jgi:hypothetical protein
MWRSVVAALMTPDQSEVHHQTETDRHSTVPNCVPHLHQSRYHSVAIAARSGSLNNATKPLLYMASPHTERYLAILS